MWVGGLALFGLLGCFFDVPSHGRWLSQDQHVATFDAMMSNKSEEPEVVFLGTSRTMNGIDTQWMGQQSGLRAFNLGLNWFGHGLRLNQCQSLLKRWRPKLVVLEAPYLLRYGVHRFCSQSLCAQTLAATPWFRPDVIARLGLPSVPRRLAAFILPQAQPSGLRLSARGYFPVPMTATQKSKSEVMAQAWLAKAGNAELGGEVALAQDLYRRFFYAHQLAYLRAIADVCRAEGVSLVLLRIPKASLWSPDPWLEHRQEQVAESWDPPRELLFRPELWRDEGHLNEEGALILSSWVLNQLSHDSRT